MFIKERVSGDQDRLRALARAEKVVERGWPARQLLFRVL